MIINVPDVTVYGIWLRRCPEDPVDVLGTGILRVRFENDALPIVPVNPESVKLTYAHPAAVVLPLPVVAV